MKKWVGPGSRPLAVKDPIGNPLTVSGTTSFSPSLAISTFSSFHLPRYSFHFSLSFFQFIVSDYLGFFFFFFFFFLKVKNNWFNRNGLTPLCLDQVLVSHILLFTYVGF